MGQEFAGGNPMEFQGYEEKLAAARLKTRLKRGGSNRKMPDWRHGNGALRHGQQVSYGQHGERRR